MKSPARKILEDMTALGFNPFDPETAAMGLQGLIAQIHPVSKGVQLDTVELDAEDGVINVRLLADSRVVWLRFYVMGGYPCLGVDYDDDDDVDVEFDLEELDPPIYDGLIDLGSIDSWMSQETLADILFNDQVPANEEVSLDDWEGSGSDGSGTPNESAGKLKRRAPKAVSNA
jgi:hypothetical protein